MDNYDTDVCTFHLRDGLEYNTRRGTDAGVNKNAYILSFRMPREELVADSPEKVASLFLAESRGPAWYDQGIRPLDYGDLVWVKPYAHMLVPAGEADSLPKPHGESRILEDWPEFAISPKHIK
jgi:hypothetical protein